MRVVTTRILGLEWKVSKTKAGDTTHWIDAVNLKWKFERKETQQ